MQSIKKRLSNSFKNSENSYSQHAHIQQKMQDFLIGILKKNSPISYFDRILELGCGIGLFSQKIAQHYNFKHFLALDIVDFSSHFNHSTIKFHQMDFENNQALQQLTKHKKPNLIISNAALQWSNQEILLPQLANLIKPKGYLLLGVFGEKNLLEFKEIFKIGLNYLSLQDYEKILQKDWRILELTQTLETLSFNHPLEALKHIKYTGVNAFGTLPITKAHLKSYTLQFQNKITYAPLYILAQKK
ncbi:MAG: methyltransferase domain-containing protein [Helicobacter sp.]|nr:methyltransferase domain-containing protein [Helicobacter sp.]